MMLWTGLVVIRWTDGLLHTTTTRSACTGRNDCPCSTELADQLSSRMLSAGTHQFISAQSAILVGGHASTTVQERWYMLIVILNWIYLLFLDEECLNTSQSWLVPYVQIEFRQMSSIWNTFNTYTSFSWSPTHTLNVFRSLVLSIIGNWNALEESVVKVLTIRQRCAIIRLFNNAFNWISIDKLYSGACVWFARSMNFEF